jgi:hypothetical protein
MNSDYRYSGGSLLFKRSYSDLCTYLHKYILTPPRVDVVVPETMSYPGHNVENPNHATPPSNPDGNFPLAKDLCKGAADCSRSSPSTSHCDNDMFHCVMT